MRLEEWSSRGGNPLDRIRLTGPPRDRNGPKGARTRNVLTSAYPFGDASGRHAWRGQRQSRPHDPGCTDGMPPAGIFEKQRSRWSTLDRRVTGEGFSVYGHRRPRLYRTATLSCDG